MATTSAYHVERSRLGASLAELRKQAGLSGTRLANALGWAQSKVSRIEKGSQTPSVEDITAWAAATAASPEVKSELLARLHVVRVEYTAWRRQLKTGHLDKQTALLNLGAHATRIRTLETAVVPSLLQTPEYARYRLLDNAALHGTPPEDVTAAVQIRMRCQQILYEPGREFEFLITETVLRTLLCPVDVMFVQLERLNVLTEMPNLKLGILPFGLPRLPWPPQHGFTAFDDQVLVETLGGEIVLHDSEQLAPYLRVWDMLQDAAHYGVQARDLITQALGHLQAKENG